MEAQYKKYIPLHTKRELEITELYSLHYFAYSKNFSFEGEVHDFWELIYCDSGEARLTDNDDEYLLPAGSAFLHKPGHFHNIVPNNKFTNVAIISFGGRLDHASACAGVPLMLDRNEKALLKSILSEGKSAFAEPLNLVYQFALKLKDNATHGAVQLISNSLENLLIGLIRKKIAAANTHENKMRNHFEHISVAIISILNENIYSTIRLKEISDRLHYSETYIKKIFREVNGESIIRYFINLKIDKAKQLISETTYSVSQISEMLGFDTVQYFSRLFKKITNMTPTAYAASVSSGVL